MTTNLAVDDALILEAQKIGRHRTQIETVAEALKEYIQRRKQKKITALFGTIDYDLDYDYKEKRFRK